MILDWFMTNTMLRRELAKRQRKIDDQRSKISQLMKELVRKSNRDSPFENLPSMKTMLEEADKNIANVRSITRKINSTAENMKKIG